MVAPWYEAPDTRLYQGDVLDVLQELPSESVHMCVTSPPYWGLRTYAACSCAQHRVKDASSTLDGSAEGTSNHSKADPDCPKCHGTGVDEALQNAQLGLEPTPEAYVERMVLVFREVRRVLRKDGALWLNLGDSYAGSGGAHDESHANPGISNSAHRNGAKRADGIIMEDSPRNRDGVGAVPNLKPKDLVGIPWRVAFALQADGWWLRSDIIWSKPNPMPESVTDRPTKSHEYVFQLTKSGSPRFWSNSMTGEASRIEPRKIGRWEEGVDWQWVTRSNGKRVQSSYWDGHDYYYDAEAIREPWTEASIARASYAYNKIGKGLNLPGGASHEKGVVHETMIDPNPGGRNKHSVWEIATQPYSGAHFATYPEALVEPCILAGTSEKGCCAECGAPWKRVVKRKAMVEAPESQTIGWTPTCKHEAPVVPCTVLDPFSGSGTTNAVARRLGRHSIGIDLKYQELAIKRLEEVPLSLFGMVP